MIYCQTINKECIAVHPLDDIDNTQYVELLKYGDISMFAVYVDDGEDEWFWEFDMSYPSDYERVKLSIFDAICGCDTMIDLARALNDIFTKEYEGILIEDECDGCNGCSGCKYKY